MGLPGDSYLPVKFKNEVRWVAESGRRRGGAEGQDRHCQAVVLMVACPALAMLCWRWCRLLALHVREPAGMLQYVWEHAGSRTAGAPVAMAVMLPPSGSAASDVSRPVCRCPAAWAAC
jgi:hypothetical protein